MKNLGLSFEVLPADIEEITEHAQTPGEVVAELALMKARRTQQILEERRAGEAGAMSTQAASAPYVILAADTLVILDNDILGKPTDRAEAISMLKRMSARSHEVYTGVHVIYKEAADKQHEHHEVGISRVHFRKLSTSEIENYVDSGEPMDKAGAYALQGIGAFLLEGIEGCPTNIIGLPLPLTMSLLRRCNISILGL
ncbi:MAG: septum formation protein Maf [Cyanobacteria bacterium REEB67]|nr:septum formation protein Maf [Cyanobacteria bacterium REEB67]